jgi:hypothetical protein
LTTRKCSPLELSESALTDALAGQRKVQKSLAIRANFSDILIPPQQRVELSGQNFIGINHHRKSSLVARAEEPGEASEQLVFVLSLSGNQLEISGPNKSEFSQLKHFSFLDFSSSFSSSSTD